MTIVVGLVATPEGRAALARAAQEAVIRSVPLVLVETGRPAPDAESAAAMETVVAGWVWSVGPRVARTSPSSWWAWRRRSTPAAW